MSKQSLELNNRTLLITGAAGFIGSNLVMALLQVVAQMLPAAILPGFAV